MEEGLFIGGGTYAGEDGIYLGLKENEDHNSIQNQDAVLSWGDKSARVIPF
jgi:hypothetical protein